MKLFLDTANIKSIKAWKETGLLDGITTNPTHLSKEGGDPKKVVLEICKIMEHSDVSVEVTESKPEAIYKQAKKIAALHENVVVKIPCYKEYYPVIKRLVEEGVAINVTLIFTLIQGMLMCKLGVRYISPFIGRLDDIDENGIDIIYALRDMVDTYGFFQTRILAASIRGVRHVHETILAGADVATLPVEVMEKMSKHPLTKIGMEKFLADWKKLDIKKFP